ncbi:Uncharacterised protein [Streptococcus pneumoniae]|nr:Uncharacterised protein [Streptococcus pneumoniae]
MTGLRPQLSASAPEISRQSASDSVVSDSARLLLAAETAKCAASNGSNGWMQYNSAKVAKPAQNSASVARR